MLPVFFFFLNYLNTRAGDFVSPCCFCLIMMTLLLLVYRRILRLDHKLPQISYLTAVPPIRKSRRLYNRHLATLEGKVWHMFLGTFTEYSTC